MVNTADGTRPVLTAALAAVILAALAVVASAGTDCLLVFLQHAVTVPTRCQPSPSVYGPALAICSTRSQVQSCLWADGIIVGLAAVAWLLALPGFTRKNSARYAGTEGSV